MGRSSPSALITDKGNRVQLRIGGRIYSLSRESLRELLDLPSGPPGLGITIDDDRFHFEFAGDHRALTISVAQLRCRLAHKIADLRHRLQFGSVTVAGLKLPLKSGTSNDPIGLANNLGATLGATTDGFDFHAFEV